MGATGSDASPCIEASGLFIICTLCAEWNATGLCGGRVLDTLFF